MVKNLSNKTKHFFFTFIKLSIVVGASYFIYNKLAHNDNLTFSNFIAFSLKNDVFLLKNTLFLLFLTIFNWFFEIKKWQNLVSSIKSIAFLDAFKQSLASLTTSLFTPNRIGEYGAKAIYFSKVYRKNILLLNLLGNMTQMCTTILFGIIGFGIFISTYNLTISYYKLFVIISLLVVVTVLAVLGFKLAEFKIKGFSIQGIKTAVLKISAKIHFKNVIFSVIRYIIFSFQFYYLLIIFNIDISYFNAMVVISTMYLLSSIIPTFFVLDVVVKGSIALYIFSFIGVDNLTVLSIVTLIWILNFVLPSILGSFYVLSFDYNKTKYSNNLI